VQVAPVFFDKQATLQKVVHQIEEAGRNGAQLIVFPESLVPCYPYGLTFGFTVGSRSEAERADWKRYYDQAVMRIGRRRSLEAMTTASIGSIPLSTRSLANSTMRMAFLAARPMIMMTPICM
jgi:predicted amidohydrolase